MSREVDMLLMRTKKRNEKEKQKEKVMMISDKERQIILEIKEEMTKPVKEFKTRKYNRDVKQIKHRNNVNKQK